MLGKLTNHFSKVKSNAGVRELCKNNKIHFISHQHITRDFSYHDGVHLTDPGTKLLADNLVDHINNFILRQMLPINKVAMRKIPELYQNMKLMSYLGFSTYKKFSFYHSSFITFL